MAQAQIHITLPEKVKNVLRTIMEGGYEAYVVGGCVRDSILGRDPQDWDITTSASPEQVKGLFRRTVDTGIKHGTVTVMMDKEGFEVTTYRIDGKYEDGRHPTEVTFTPNLEEDLKRRDFTINAMAYNEQEGLVDLFGGMRDIEGKVIRCVGNPEARFGEDALRIMRAIRFSAQLGYAIEDQTFAAIRKLASTLEKISAERIREELVKLVVSPHPDYLRVAYEAGVTAVILPEFDRAMETPQNHPHHCYNVGEHILHSMCSAEPDRVLRLAMLFHDIGKPVKAKTDEAGVSHFYGHAAASEKLTATIMKRLRFDNDTISSVCRLVRYHDYGLEQEPCMMLTRKAINKVGEDIFPRLLQVRKADILAQSEFRREEKLEKNRKWEEYYERVVKEGQCVSLKTLAVTGSDLIAAGMKPGRELGDTLQKMLEIVIEDPDKNNREFLLNWLENFH